MKCYRIGIFSLLCSRAVFRASNYQLNFCRSSHAHSSGPHGLLMFEFVDILDFCIGHHKNLHANINIIEL